MFFQVMGIVTVVLFSLILMFFFVELLLILLYKYRKKILFPLFSLKMMAFYYSPLKGTMKFFGFDPQVVDEALIVSANESMAKRFVSAEGEKLIFAPQCLRSSECKARLDPDRGYICKKCGKCVLGEIAKLSEDRGYVLFIVPGDSFVKRIVRNLEPASVIGVACYDELSMAMLVGIKMGIPSVGIPLLKSGCFNTLVEFEKIKRNMV